MAMKRSKLPLQHSKNEATEEMLAHTLTVIRHRMQEQAQLIIAVEPPKGDGKIFSSCDQNQRWKAMVGCIYQL
mgnify:CR=1 FL=1